MSDAARVFLIQENSRLGFGPAKEYGALVDPIFPEHTQIYHGDQTEEVVNVIWDHLSNNGFGDDDYIALSGDPVLIALTCAIASTLCNGQLRLLKFDRHHKKYFAVLADSLNG